LKITPKEGQGVNFRVPKCEQECIVKKPGIGVSRSTVIVLTKINPSEEDWGEYEVETSFKVIHDDALGY
jgi:hypothetical protein